MKPPSCLRCSWQIQICAFAVSGETTKNALVTKVGDTLYLCRTCSREYNSSMELCGACYAADSQKHRRHEIGQPMIQRVTDMPDDREGPTQRLVEM